MKHSRLACRVMPRHYALMVASLLLATCSRSGLLVTDPVNDVPVSGDEIDFRGDTRTGDEMGSPGDTSKGDQTLPSDEGPWPLSLSLEDFDVVEITPNTFKVVWWPEGVAQGFQRYEVWVGTDQMAVQENRAPAVMWGPNDDPNLGYMIQRAAQVVNHTRVLSLQANTDYFVLLQAVAGAQIVGRTSILSVSTPPVPTDSIDIYRDTWTAGWSIDADWALSESSTINPYQGSESLRLQINASPIPESQNTGFPFQYAALNVSLGNINDSVLNTAYLEFAIDCAGGSFPYGEIALFSPSLAQSDSRASLWYNYPNYYVCVPGYRVVQIPLNAFNGNKGSSPSIDAFGGVLAMFWIYGGWKVGDVYMDEIRIRYQAPSN